MAQDWRKIEKKWWNIKKETGEGGKSDVWSALTWFEKMFFFSSFDVELTPPYTSPYTPSQAHPRRHTFEHTPSHALTHPSDLFFFLPQMWSTKAKAESPPAKNSSNPERKVILLPISSSVLFSIAFLLQPSKELKGTKCFPGCENFSLLQPTALS
jgi:hypothetical protein